MISGPDRRKLVLIDEADKEAALFFVRWLQAPHRIGAVAPSSRHLGRAMARQVLSAGPGPIIELGGGTGSVTKALLEAGIAPERLIVVERDEKLHRILRAHFPKLRVTMNRILAESFALLGEGRPFVQFTYGLTSPIARERKGLTGRIAARVWANLPPAS